jgi:hypothetical protein
MSKPFSVADLSDQMDRDMNWRLKEFSDMKAAIGRADPVARPVLLRALIALMYAHWEGHVRLCSTKYFQHVALRKMPYDQLETQIYLNSFLVRLDSFFRSKGTVEDKCQFVEDVLRSKDKRFSHMNAALLDTKANLNTDLLRDLCRICGIAFTEFEKNETFIDVLMLKRRNEIAHGEEVYLKEDEVDTLVEQVVNVMRLFRNLLENKAYDRSYLAKY